VTVIDIWDKQQLTFKSANGTCSQDYPDWMVRLAALPVIGSTFNATLSSGQGLLFWDIGDIAPGETVELTLVMTANSTIPAGYLMNSALILGTYYDTNHADNMVSETTSIESTDLSIMKMGYPEPVATGGELTYLVMVSNNGPVDATGVVAVGQLPVEISGNVGGLLRSPSVPRPTASATTAQPRR